jgi:predicted MFS family arabinose efflux permease
MFALVFIITSLVSGYILDHAPLNLGYQIIFWLGAAGAAMSTLQLWHLRHVTGETVPGPAQIRGVIGDQARPGDMRGMGMSGIGGVALRAFARGTNLLRFEVLRDGYGKVIGALFFFHFAQFLPTSVFPLYWVNSLHFSDGVISIGSAVFNSAVLFGSLQISHLVKRWGNHTLMVCGVLLMSLHPLVTAFTTNLTAFFLASLIGGAAWSIVGGAVGNYLLEKVPNTDRPAYLAWYNLALNAAVLLGSLGGSWLAKEIDLSTALVVSFGIRALAAYAIWQAE